MMLTMFKGETCGKRRKRIKPQFSSRSLSLCICLSVSVSLSLFTHTHRTLFTNPLMLFLRASQVMRWYCSPALSFAFCSSSRILKGGMYTPGVREGGKVRERERKKKREEKREKKERKRKREREGERSGEKKEG